MIPQHMEEMATLYAADALPAAERAAFETTMRSDPELCQLVRQLQRTSDLLIVAGPAVAPPSTLRQKVLNRIASLTAPTAPGQAPPGLHFNADVQSGQWKPLPVPGAYVKLLSMQRHGGYAVLLGKLDPGAHYPAHVNAGPEDFYILTGDLVFGERTLKAGDYHRADRGVQHEESYSVQGCTLLAVVTIDDPMVAFASA